MKLKLTLVSAAVALALSLPQAALADDLETQLNAQQSSMLRLQNDFLQMQSQLDAQNGRIEELEHEIATLKTTIAKLKSAAPAEAQEQAAEQGQDGRSAEQNAPAADAAKTAPAAATAAKVTDSKGNALKSVDDAAKKKYDAAYQLVVGNKLKEAASAFKSYVEKYPDNELTPNAWYWLGQVQYKQKQYDEARVSFLNAQSFKNSPKRPDSLYKLGLITKAQGDAAKAKRYFEVVVKNYPDDTSAQLARKQLEQ